MSQGRVLRGCVEYAHHRANASHKASTEHHPYKDTVREERVEQMSERTWVHGHHPYRETGFEHEPCGDSSEAQSYARILERAIEIFAFSLTKSIARFAVQEPLREDDAASDSRLGTSQTSLVHADEIRTAVIPKRFHASA